MRNKSILFRTFFLLAAACMTLLTSCGGDEPEPSASAPVLISTDPVDGISELEGTSLSVKFTFDIPVTLTDKGGISAGDAVVSEVLAMARYVNITVTDLKPGKSYTISIPEGGICSLASPGAYAKALSFSFSMKPEPVKPDEPEPYDPGDVGEWESAATAVAAMRTGWNLGNTLDSNSGDTDNMWIEAWTSHTVADYETAWGQPQTTRELIHMFKEAGFNAIRVPVTWYPHMGKLSVSVIDGKAIWDKNSWTGYEVDPKWMARVKEVVNYVIDEGLYCILNVHHDTGASSNAWLRADAEAYEKYSGRFIDLWNQIATEFAEYDEKLLFESFNEMLDARSTWNTTTAEGYDIINKYNSDFVHTVRATGGNNACRNLVLNTYAASADPDALKHFVLPQDSVKDHLIAEVHSYAPYRFAFDMDNPSDQQKKFDSSCEGEVKWIISNLNDLLVKKGIPVIIGEYGATSKAEEEEMAKQAACYVSTAREYGIKCFYWMALSDGEDRSRLKWTKPLLKDAIVSASR